MKECATGWLEQLCWNEQGLLPAVAQHVDTGEVLMLAWMNREALLLTLETGEAVYWSRSRGRLWRKGEQSGHVQQVHEIRTDCDCDALLLRVTQHGGIACHTGRKSCFFRLLEGGVWRDAEPVIKNPADIYR